MPVVGESMPVAGPKTHDIVMIDRLPPTFAAASLAPLFEGAPAFLRRLVDAHPRLGAPPGIVSALSFREQGYDVDAATEAERLAVDAELQALNQAYEMRFGFRYCVFVAGRGRGELLPAFRAALEGDRSTQLRRALSDVIRIAAARQQRLAEAAQS